MTGEDKLESLEIKNVDGDYMVDYTERANDEKLSSMETRSRVVKYLEEFNIALSRNLVKKFSLNYEPKEQKVMINKGYSDASDVEISEEPNSISSQANTLLKMACHLKLEGKKVPLFHRQKQGNKNKYEQATIGSTLRSLIEGLD